MPRAQATLAMFRYGQAVEGFAEISAPKVCIHRQLRPRIPMSASREHPRG